MKVSASSSESASYSILEKLNRIIQIYFELGQQVYFLGESEFFAILGIVFLSLTLVIGLYRFSGNKQLLTYWLLIQIIYFYAASNFTGNFVVHYKLLIWISPILFSVMALAYLKKDDLLERGIYYVCIILIIVSILLNLKADFQFLDSKYGSQRLLSPDDMITLLNQLPPQSTLCTYYPTPNLMAYEYPYRYIDRYINQNKLTILDRRKPCKSGNYYIAQNYIMDQRTDYLFPMFEVIRNQPVLQRDYQTFFENEVAKIYLIK